jgi:GNAT superfamily N-acetyltransferase
MKINLIEDRNINSTQILNLYKANKWSSAEKPEELMKALKNSHSIITAWDGDKLIGLANSISDGYLVVYYPHLLVHPDYQGKGIGKMIMDNLQEKYSKFHQQVLIADGRAIDFYKKCGFEKAGKCEAMWIYKGHDHDF